MPTPAELSQGSPCKPNPSPRPQTNRYRSAAISSTLIFLRFFTSFASIALILARILPLTTARGKDLTRALNSQAFLSLWFIGIYKTLFHISFVLVEYEITTTLLVPKDDLLHRGFLQTFLGLLDLGVSHRDAGVRFDLLFSNASSELSPRESVAIISDVFFFLASRILIACGTMYMLIGAIGSNRRKAATVLK